MSGLFATLAAAAQGGEGTLQARPRGTFEPDPAAGFEADGDEVQIAESATEGGEASPRPLPQARRTQGLAADVLLPEARAAQGPGVRDVFSAGDQPSEPWTLLPEVPAAPPGARGAAREAADVSTGGRSTPRAEARISAPPVRPAAPSADSPAARVPVASETRGPEASAPPLLLAPLTSAEGDAARPLSPRPQDNAIPRTPERRSLSIGRIEVRPPPPAPAPPPPPQQTYRATAIPRALPRQSLDDYRRRGR
jgi:hypothetical protein